MRCSLRFLQCLISAPFKRVEHIHLHANNEFCLFSKCVHLELRSGGSTDRGVKVLMVSDLFSSEDIWSQLWAKPLEALLESGAHRSLAAILIDKWICAHADLFIPSWLSTFSNDIKFSVDMDQNKTFVPAPEFAEFITYV